MPSTEGHKSFPITFPRDQPIWRYLTFSKFIDMLQRESLWFSRADSFEDVFEGRLPKMNAEAMKDHPAGDATLAFEMLRRFQYLNCWHVSDHESVAMWKMYAVSHEAVAIRSTYERLHTSMPEECYIGEVAYIDYREQYVDVSNSYNVIMTKRRSFAHERELRAIITEEIPSTETDDDGFPSISLSAQNPHRGRHVKVELTSLIEQIVVAPTSPNWFLSLVQGAAIDSGFDASDVVRSDLDQLPY